MKECDNTATVLNLLLSTESVVVAGHVSHDGTLIWFGDLDEICTQNAG